MNGKTGALVLLVVIVLSACATGPAGPSASVMPAPGVPLGKFQPVNQQISEGEPPVCKPTLSP